VRNGVGGKDFSEAGGGKLNNNSRQPSGTEGGEVLFSPSVLSGEGKWH